MPSPSTTRALLRASHTLKPSHIQRTSLRFSSTSTSTTTPTRTTARPPIYFSSDVYWGKAVKNAGNTFLLYVPVVAAVMFWPTPIAPFFNLLKGVKNMEVEA